MNRPRQASSKRAKRAKRPTQPVPAKTTRPRPAAAKPSEPMAVSARIEKVIKDLGDWRGERLAAIRRLIHQVDPEVVEEWKWMGTPVWSHDGMFALANAHKDKVKLTFFHGAKLRDPKGLFNAGLTGNKWRAIDFREGDKLDRPALAALLREAVAYNTTHPVPKSRGSTAANTTTAKVVKRSVSKRLATKPVLLSGGNPQIPKADGDAPVQAYIAAMPGWKREVGRRLDALVERIVPNVRKAVRWNSPFYGVEGQGWFLSFHCFTKYVKVTFLRGAALRPLPPGPSKDKNVRYLDLYDGDPLDGKLLASWLEQASGLPGERLF